MNSAERALLNAQTMDDSQDRSFCGIELGRVYLINRRYIERMISKFTFLRYTLREISIGYAYILTLELSQLRIICRDDNLFDEGLDNFISKLPDPIPESELKKLADIVDLDIATLKAAEVDLSPKPGESVDPATPPNS